jgi:hypothetical protein
MAMVLWRWIDQVGFKEPPMKTLLGAAIAMALIFSQAVFADPPKVATAQKASAAHKFEASLDKLRDEIRREMRGTPEEFLAECELHDRKQTLSFVRELMIEAKTASSADAVW